MDADVAPVAKDELVPVLAVRRPAHVAHRVVLERVRLFVVATLTNRRVGLRLKVVDDELEIVFGQTRQRSRSPMLIGQVEPGTVQVVQAVAWAVARHLDGRLRHVV